MTIKIQQQTLMVLSFGIGVSCASAHPNLHLPDESPQLVETQRAIAPAPVIPSTGDSARSEHKLVIPTGTKIPFIVNVAFRKRTSQEGDLFTAYTARDIDVEGQIPLPAGTILNGRVGRPAPINPNSGASGLVLNFESAISTTGQRMPVSATLVQHGGNVYSKRGFKTVYLKTVSASAPAALGTSICFWTYRERALKARKPYIPTAVGVSSDEVKRPPLFDLTALPPYTVVIVAPRGTDFDIDAGDELKLELAKDLVLSGDKVLE